MKGLFKRLPQAGGIMDPATRFVLELDLENLTEEELNYLHKLRTMAQRTVIENFLKKRP